MNMCTSHVSPFIFPVYLHHFLRCHAVPVTVPWQQWLSFLSMSFTFWRIQGLHPAYVYYLVHHSDFPCSVTNGYIYVGFYPFIQSLILLFPTIQKLPAAFSVVKVMEHTIFY
ncbi:hypothetical protein BDW75DRAFT_71978 [Aspergillus navahoensis]